MKKMKQDYLTPSLLAAAAAVTGACIVTSLKKRNFAAALASTATLIAMGGLWYLNDDRQSIVGKYCFDEGFKPSKRKKAPPTELTNRRYTLPIHEIPVDNEATEEDFIK